MNSPGSMARLTLSTAVTDPKLFWTRSRTTADPEKLRCSAAEADCGADEFGAFAIVGGPSACCGVDRSMAPSSLRLLRLAMQPPPRYLGPNCLAIERRPGG